MFGATFMIPLYALLVVRMAVGVYMDEDWLVTPISERSEVREGICWLEYGHGVCGLELRNGLVSRRFVLSPAFGTIDFIRNATAQRGGEQTMLRSLESEASVTLDGVKHEIGGLRWSGGHRAYMNRTEFLDNLVVDTRKETFRYTDHTITTELEAPFPWTPGTRHGLKNVAWPPRGAQLRIAFTNKKLPGIVIAVNYEIYDGIPLMSKWVTVAAKSGRTKRDKSRELRRSHPTKLPVVDAVIVERFAAMPGFGSYEFHTGAGIPGDDDVLGLFVRGSASKNHGERPLLYARTDQAHGARCAWVNDKENHVTTAAVIGDLDPRDGEVDDGEAPWAPPPPPPPRYQASLKGASEPLLLCNYTVGPGVHIIDQSHTIQDEKPSFMSFRVLMIAMDSTDLERQTLARHRVSQILAPHSTENPIFFHATDTSDKGFRTAVDQMAEVGFEMLIFSFGTNFDMSSTDPDYLKKLRKQVKYAKERGIEVGGYDLIVLQRGKGGYGKYVGDAFTTIDPVSGELGKDACIASGWYETLTGYIRNMIETTGLTMVEVDGPYEGRGCASTEHAHHHGVEDSIYHQMRLQNEFMTDMRRLGVYVNQPDDYQFQGGSRRSMGYSEDQFSLPRWEDLSVSRMGMYDDLYNTLPTYGWMFVPLVPYHSGGQAASFLNNNLEYEWALAQYLGAGTAACYRGPILYNASSEAGLEMREVLRKWVGFYKAHRETLIQPIVHLRRPDLQAWDGWLHVNPWSSTTERGLAMLFNPTMRDLDVRLAIPLYYTGLTTIADISINGGDPVRFDVGRDYFVHLTLRMPSKSIHTLVFTAPYQQDGDAGETPVVAVEDE